MLVSRQGLVVIRADASLRIGNGHVMRCLTLADALTEQGAECHFICREHPGHLIEFIRSKGYPVHVLPIGQTGPPAKIGPSQTPHASWLGTTQAQDAEGCRAVLMGLQPDWLIVDHYALDVNWEESLGSCCRRLMVIDDLADRPHSCELLLDQNLGRKKSDYEGLVPARCTILAGPKYALLRPEFKALRQYSLKRRANKRLGNILITLGGVDQYNATGNVLDALKHCSLPGECRINVVLGPQAPWLGQVRASAAELSCLTEVFVNVSNMAQLMADCDLAIGAAGSTSWERCCLGVPSLIVVLAENQWGGAKALDSKHAAILIGDLSSIGTHLKAGLAAAQGDMHLISKMASQVTEGKGTALVLDYLVRNHAHAYDR